MKPEMKEYIQYAKERENREKKLNQCSDIIESILNYLHWIQYCHPQDENERWYNRGIDRAIETIEDNFTI